MLDTATVDQPVAIVRTGPLVVHDATDRARYEREVHTFTPGVADGHERCAARRRRGRVLGVVVLDNRGDGVAYAVTAAELAGLLDRAPARTPRPTGARG